MNKINISIILLTSILTFFVLFILGILYLNNFIYPKIKIEYEDKKEEVFIENKREIEKNLNINIGHCDIPIKNDMTNIIIADDYFFYFYLDESYNEKICYLKKQR